MYNILKLNEISPVVDKVFNKDYNLTKECSTPDAILLRSFAMHDYPLNNELLCVARCGAGTNNIPIDKCTDKGIVVFNTPGANANAVKELVITSLLLASRKIVPAIEWTKSLKGKSEVAKAVEKGKGAFVGPELYGKKLGVIGLGAIGAMVANSAIDLGMDVLGYDPFISIDSAWTLSRGVHKITDLAELLKESDYITIHVPLTPNTKGMFNKEAFSKMKQDSALINCSRAELVNNADIIEALNSKKLSRYVTDFPVEEVIDVDGIVAIPHLGASTPEAEDNCAYMASKELVDYLENGNISNSVNFPNCTQNRSGKTRITIHHKNIKEMINKITGTVSKSGLNIANFVDKSQGENAYSIMDIDSDINTSVIDELKAIEGIIRVRIIK